ncbi:MAG: acyltransferase [Bacteroides sp.]|nr:acyltransferase [Bacteroides sp.]MCM1095506.1 acyltransferase [Terasakiella sp.]
MRYDICTLRAAAILAIVLHHSALYVCANALGTETFSPLHMDDFTLHVCWLCKVIGLGLFTFISGALLRMQMPRLTSRRAFIIKKIRRIAIPSAVMAVAYALCFPSMSFDVGGLYLCQAHTHLWYLPFIFMALVLTFLVKPDLSPAGIIKIAALLVATRLYSVYVPVYSFNMCVYYPVFLAGYLFSNLKLNRLAQIGGVMIFIALYIGGPHAPLHRYAYLLTTAMSIIVGMTGMAMVRSRADVRPGPLTALLDRQSFHIYLIHQFVINFIVIAVAMSGPAWMWWPGVFVATMAASLALCAAYDSASSRLSTILNRLRPINTPNIP